MKRDPRKVFVGVATGSGQTGVTRWQTSMSLIRLCVSESEGLHFYLCPGGGCDVAHVRNMMNHECATRTDCGTILHLDSDVVPAAGDLVRLVRHVIDNEDIQICAGLYPLKGLALRWSYGLWAEDAKAKPGLWEVGEVCGGLTAYKFGLWEQLVAAHPDSRYTIEDSRFRGETGHEVYSMGHIVERDWNRDGKPFRRRMSEDFMFSMKVRDLGHPIYVDPTIQAGHIWNTFDCLQLHKKGGVQVAEGRE